MRPGNRPLQICAALAMSMGAQCAWAQSAADNYPTRPVIWIYPYTPGGVNDIEGRIYLQRLSEAFGGRPFLADYRPGAGGVLGTAAVAKAVPDGHTLLGVTPSFTINPAVYKDLPFDTSRDFVPISLMSRRASMLVVHPSVPAKNFAEYVSYLKANPGKLNFGTSGAGATAHLSGAWLNDATGTKLTFVHYKGSSQLLLDLLGGQIQVSTLSAGVVAPYIKAGKLRVLGMSDVERSPQFPGIPTVAEQGVPEFEYSSWLGFAAPRGTPPAVVNRLGSELGRIARMPDLVQKLAADGTVIVGNTPEQFQQYITGLINRWQRLVKAADIRLEE